MRITISRKQVCYASVAQQIEKYYDNDDIVDEKIDFLYPFVAKHVDLEPIAKAIQTIGVKTTDKILFLGKEFYRILYLVVKRSSLFSKETLHDKVARKVTDYKIAHRISHGNKVGSISVFMRFREMFEHYCNTAALSAKVDTEYKSIPKNIRAGIGQQMYLLIGVTS
jgi:hypothetical protein